MSQKIRTIAVSAAVLAASLAALAQTAAPAPTPPAAGGYNSAFEGYRPFSAEEVGDWKKANDTVREVGGWRAYAREIQGGTQSAPAGPSAAPPRPAASAPPAASTAPAATAAPVAPALPAPRPADPHQGHHQ